MAKIKLTKNELKTQKDSLKRYTRYLPTLQLKKQQLQMEILKVRAVSEKLQTEIEKLEEKVCPWVDVFAEDIDLTDFLKVKEVKTETGNIAGIDIPIFSDIEFDEEPYDFFTTPLWVDKGIEIYKELIIIKAKLLIVNKQEELLKEELRITVQRVNLFEKVKIPESRENIRVIRIYLGDLQTAEVVRGKITKTKIEKKKEAAVI